MKMSEEGKEQPPERNQNLPSDTAITFHALKLFHCVEKSNTRAFALSLQGWLCTIPLVNRAIIYMEKQ